MYQQVYWHATVRGAERILRAVYERASDPARPSKYKDNVGVPDSMRNVLSGKRSTLDEFLANDDIAVWGTVKHWAETSIDPVLQYLSRCLLQRKLFKEIKVPPHADVTMVRDLAREVVRDVFSRQPTSGLPRLDPNDGQAIDYFVLVDMCEFKTDNRLEGILFKIDESTPKPLDDIKDTSEYDVISGLGPFRRSESTFHLRQQRRCARGCGDWRKHE
jgi:hypothetical protein